MIALHIHATVYPLRIPRNPCIDSCAVAREQQAPLLSRRLGYGSELGPARNHAAPTQGLVTLTNGLRQERSKASAELSSPFTRTEATFRRRIG